MENDLISKVPDLNVELDRRSILKTQMAQRNNQGIDSMDTVTVDGLKKSYNALPALDGISFSVGKGEIFGLLGPNGAGKTTTIRILSGLTKPASGRALIMGNDVVISPVTAKGLIGVVPETSNLYPELTCAENLVFAGRLYGMDTKKARSKTGELLAAFWLQERQDAPFGALSSGMKRRLTLAASLIHEPPVLFLDEPTTGLDVPSARALREMIRSLKNRGTSILLTTHYIEEADRLCDRIAVIVKGRIVAVDTPEALKKSAGEERAMDIRAVPRDFREQKLLSGMSGVKRVEMKEDGVRFFIEDMNAFLAAISAFAAAKGFSIESAHTVTPSLEDAFVRITGLKPEIMIQEKEDGK
jgi:ABC-2 type transport system ATP-binding protein